MGSLIIVYGCTFVIPIQTPIKIKSFLIGESKIKTLQSHHYALLPPIGQTKIDLCVRFYVKFFRNYKGKKRQDGKFIC